MKKILPYLFVAMFAFGCSNDDDKKPSEPDDITLRPCANGITLILNTQEEVNNFAALGYCSVGELKIGSPDWPSDITDLTPLSTILNVQREITVSYNPQLTSLHGLHNITNAGGKLSIVNNPALVSLDGLSSLKTIKGDILIAGNAALTSAAGLKNAVPAESGYITIKDNPLLTVLSLDGVTTANTIEISNTGLQSLSGFPNLTTAIIIRATNNSAFESLGLNAITGLDDLTIKGCPALQSIAGLENIAKLERLEITDTASFNALGPLHNTAIYSIVLVYNEGLISLDGLESVTEVNTLTLTGNPQLASLQALSNLKTVRRSVGYAGFYIFENNALQTLNGLEGITDFKATMMISQNPSLSDFCAIQNIIDHGDIDPASSFISGNLYQPDFTQPGGCSMD